jgi:hypothetical protein
MIRIVDYKPEHLAAIELRECHRTERPESIQTQAVTFLKDEEPLAILGWYQMMPGVGQGWALLSEKVTTCPIAFHKAVKSFLAFVFYKFKLRRLQISVRVGYQKGYYWAKSLGFICEGIMNRYAPDDTACWLFARIQ